MKIFSSKQIRDWDTFTIQNEPIKSIDLMERASLTFVNWFLQKFQNTARPISIFCGQGNNGGDGLAIGRLLQQCFYNIEIFICKIGNTPSSDFFKNLQRLPDFQNIQIHEIEKGDDFPNFKSVASANEGIIIDAIFGSGLNRKVEGYWGELLEYLNQQNQTIVSVDIPSGVFADQPTEGISIYADYTFSFETPKLAFLFPENEDRIGAWFFDTIQLNPKFLDKTESPFFYLEKKYVRGILKTRKKFSHKGTYGHALIIAGGYGKVGAAILATQAALRTGAGLVSTHAPKCAYTLLQTTTPEAMVSIDEHDLYFSKTPNLEKYNAIGIGCGIGMGAVTASALEDFLKKIKTPIVLDADALNIISQNKKWISDIPNDSILTPHPKEFERLLGKTKNNFERNQLQRNFSQKNQLYIILKGANTCITTPQGHCYFNSTGNPGMATGGSGDVLTGILTSLLAQGYNSLETSILGVYLHGLTGDLALSNEVSQESLLASDLVSNIGKGWNEIRAINR